MVTRVLKLSVFALVATATLSMGAESAKADGSISIAFGRRFVRPATTVVHRRTTVVAPVAYRPVIVGSPAVVPVGDPRYPYMVRPGVTYPGFVSPGYVFPGYAYPGVIVGGRTIVTGSVVSRPGIVFRARF